MPSEDTQFKPGNPGGPGRPKGSRDKLAYLFIKTLAEDFEEHGLKVIQQLREDKPHQYTQVIGRLMPKIMELSGPDGESIPLEGKVKFVKGKDDDG